MPRSILSAVLAVCVSLTFWTPAASTTHFVVVMTDDLSTNMLDDALNAGLMPNLQTHIIDQGMTFSESFVSNALCCPSRATFLTGLYTRNHGVLTNFFPDGGVTAFDDTSTLATWLQDGGYETGFVGKYLNGYGRNVAPDDPKDNATYIPPGWDDWRALVELSNGSRVYGYTMNENGTIVDYGSDPSDYQTDVLAGHAVSFIDGLVTEDGLIETPFFLWVPTLAPHAEGFVLCDLPTQELKTIRPADVHDGKADGIPLPRSPAFNEIEISDKPNWLQAAFPDPLDEPAIECLETSYRDRLESLLSVDDLIGDVVAKLEEFDALDDTVLIFTSDNGHLFGEHRIALKSVPYDQSIRVPLYVRGPTVAPGSTEASLVVNNDLPVTITDWAGISPASEVDGRSLVPLLEGTPVGDWRSRIFIENYDNSAPFPQWPATFVSILTNDQSALSNRQFVVYLDGPMEFYNLVDDPHQLDSRHEELRQGQVDSVLSIVQDFLVCSGPTCRQLEEGAVQLLEPFPE